MKKSLTIFTLLLVVVAMAPLSAAEKPDTISLRLSDAPVSKALIPAKIDPVDFLGLSEKPSLAQEPVVSVYARYVPKAQYLDVLEKALGLGETPEPRRFRLAKQSSLFTLEELSGFQRLIVNGRNLLEEAIVAAEAATNPDDVDTLNYLGHRRLLSAGDPSTISSGGNAFLGVQLFGKNSTKLEEMAPEAIDAHARWDGHGAFVGNIIPASGAFESGLLPGDVVVAINGIWIDSSCTLRKLTSRVRLGSEVELLVLRNAVVQREWAIVAERIENPTP